MRLLRTILAGGVALLAACGGDDGTRPSGPVTFVPVSYILGGDTVGGIIAVDGGDTLRINRDSIVGLARGDHEVFSRLDLEYLEYRRTERIDPSGSREQFLVTYAPSCLTTTSLQQQEVCAAGKLLTWSGSRRILCSVNDYGDFCTGYTDPLGIGARWPADTAATLADGYISQAKLLVGAILGNEVPAAAGDTVAMALYTPGDYGPRERLRVVPGDSSRWQTRVWTDLRHTPFPNVGTPYLEFDDRPLARFGLEVRTTYHLPASQPNVLFVRFDVRNVSNEPHYRFVHPNAPANGWTVNQIYLAPMVDVNVGTPILAEVNDDNATLFPAESLLVGYDQHFAVNNFGTAGSRTQPGLVGLRLLQAPAAAKGLILEFEDQLSYETNNLEDNSYRLLAAGRAGTPASSNACADRGEALVCTPENWSNVVMGWSVGPIPSLAPGQSTTLTVAILFARPKAGSFTSGNAVSPRNNEPLTSTTRQIYDIAEPLRMLGNAISGTTVPVP